MFADGNDLAGPGQRHLEGLPRLRREEFLVVDRLCGPALRLGGPADPVDHPLRPADIEMCAERLPIEKIDKVDDLLVVVVVDVDVAAMLVRQLIHVRAERRAPHGVMQLEVAVHRADLLDLRQKRRDPDPARDH